MLSKKLHTKNIKKMNLIRQKFLYLIVLPFTLICCTSNIDDIENKVAIRTIHLSIAPVTGKIDKTPSPSPTRSYSTEYLFSEKNAFPHFDMKNGATVEGMCVLKNENKNIPPQVITTTWTMSCGELKTKKIDVNINVPKSEHIGKWSILYTLGKWKYDKITHSMLFNGGVSLQPITKENNNRLWMNIPYLSLWTDVRQDDKVTNIKFIPQGSIVRMQMRNTTKHTLKIKTIRMEGVDPTSEAKPFTTCGYVNVMDNKANMVYIKDPMTTTYTLPNEITLEDRGKSNWYAIWVMPMGKDKIFSTDVYVYPENYTKTQNVAWWLYNTPLFGMSNSVGIESGKSYTLKMKLKQNVSTMLDNWMQGIEDTRKICKMSIPGTHDTAADTGNDWVKTQDWNLKDQLKNGIRFLDIRLFLDNGVLKLCHSNWVFSTTFTKDVLYVVRDFLKAHPSETVLFTIKKDNGSGAGFADAVNNAINNDKTLKPYLVGTFKPGWTMGDVRGKMVPISREGWYTTCCGYIPHWYDNRSFNSYINGSDGWSSAEMFVEDTYKTSGGTKRDCVMKNVEMANKAYSTDNNSWYITFCSYTGPLGIDHPWRITDYINKYLEDRLTKHYNTCGIVLYNFCNYYESSFTKRIISLNKITLQK